jgi:hypothetical protein
MSSWINLTAIWKILAYSLLLGAGLPALFAVGLVALNNAEATATAGSTGTVTRKPLRVAAAGLCFTIVVAAIGYGIYLIVKG